MDSEFEANLVYRESSKIARATQRDPVSTNQKKGYSILTGEPTSSKDPVSVSMTAESQTVSKLPNFRDSIDWNNEVFVRSR